MFRYLEYIDNKGISGIIRRSCNYVDSRLMDHGVRVASIALEIVKELGKYTDKEIRDIGFLALLHDIGAYKTEEVDKMTQFEIADVMAHSVYGYLFIKYFSPIKYLSEGVLYHHSNWSTIKNSSKISDEIKEIAQVLNIADRIDICMKYEKDNWSQCALKIKECSGTKFCSKLVDIILSDNFLNYIENTYLKSKISTDMLLDLPHTQDEITDYLKMLIYMIDFRSKHTVTHTMTTTGISYELARLVGLDENYRSKIVCGALLHDLGKIGIPVEILEHPGKLSPQAMNIMRTHVDIGRTIFGGEIEPEVTEIALRHHEKPNGSGYPQGLTDKELTVGEKIVAVADIVSALSGTRSYKDAFSNEKIVEILTKMRDDGLADKYITDLVILHIDEIMDKTKKICNPLIDQYYAVQHEYMQIKNQGYW